MTVLEALAIIKFLGEVVYQATKEGRDLTPEESQETAARVTAAVDRSRRLDPKD